jgi:hypothetical protein
MIRYIAGQKAPSGSGAERRAELLTELRDSIKRGGLSERRSNPRRSLRAKAEEARDAREATEGRRSGSS